MKKGQCPTCKKDFDAGVIAAYKLGQLDGTEEMQKMINVLSTTNRRLFDELLRLDKRLPVLGDPKYITITLSLRQWRIITQRLKIHREHYHARMIDKMIGDRRINSEALVEEIKLLAEKSGA